MNLCCIATGTLVIVDRNPIITIPMPQILILLNGILKLENYQTQSLDPT